MIRLLSNFRSGRVSSACKAGLEVLAARLVLPADIDLGETANHNVLKQSGAMSGTAGEHRWGQRFAHAGGSDHSRTEHVIARIDHSSLPENPRRDASGQSPGGSLFATQTLSKSISFILASTQNGCRRAR